MVLTDVIIMLREQCPIFGRRVAGTQAFTAAASVNSDIDVPCCFIVPLFDAGSTLSENTYSQQITENFATIVCLNNALNKKDGQGMSAEANLVEARRQLTAALLMWTPVNKPAASGTAYVRGQHLFMNNSRIWHQFQWSIAYYEQADMSQNAAYLAAQAVLFDELDSQDTSGLKEFFVPDNPGAGGDPNPADYHAILEVIKEIDTVDWVRVSDIPQPNKSPAFVMAGTGKLIPDPAYVKPKDQLE